MLSCRLKAPGKEFASIHVILCSVAVMGGMLLRVVCGWLRPAGEWLRD